MKPKSLFWGEHTWEELTEIAESGAVVVVPFGAFEQHGPMLPVDTDTNIARRWSEDGGRMASDEFGVPVLLLPPFPFGISGHHRRFAGTIWIDPEPYIALVTQVLSCVMHHGFRRIAVLSGHGGNDPGISLAIKNAVTQAENQRPVRIACFEDHRDPVFAKLSHEIWASEPSQGQFAFHADRWETSETLADRPHLVRRDRMVKAELISIEKPEWGYMTHHITKTGASGDPSLARADLGERVWAAWAEAMALFIKRLWETPLPESNDDWTPV